MDVLYMYIILLILVSYLAGSVPFGLIVARLAGNIDIRQKGSGNIGATNVGRVMGKKWGVLVMGFDFAKGFIPVFFGIMLVQLLAEDGSMSGFTVQLAMVLAGLGALLGHVFPLYLKFKGGKGVATSAGVFCALSWKVMLTALAVWIILVLITKYVSVASMCAAVLTPLMYIGYEYKQAFSTGLPVLVFTCILALLVVFRHRSNIKRLLNGTENKVLQKKKEQTRQDLDPD